MEYVGRGPLSIVRRIRAEQNNLTWYNRRNTEDMLGMVKLFGHLNVNDSVDTKQF